MIRQGIKYADDGALWKRGELSGDSNFRLHTGDKGTHSHPVKKVTLKMLRIWVCNFK